MSRTSRPVPAQSATRRGAAARVRLGAVGLVAAAGLVLTGCSTVKTGAAAVVEGDRIEVATLNAQVERFEQAAADEGLRIPGTDGQLTLTRTKLVQMLQWQVIDVAAERAGVGVTATEVLEARQSFEATSGGPEAARQWLLQEAVVLPEQIDGFIRSQLLQQKIAAAQGIDPATEQGRQALNEALVRTARSMSVKLNPRYGDWDPAALEIVPAAHDWLIPRTEGAPA